MDKYSVDVQSFSLPLETSDMAEQQLVFKAATVKIPSVIT